MPAPTDEHGPAGILGRSLAILELLATAPAGLPMQEVADHLGIPRSAAHRLLNGLADHGYVRQDRQRGFYGLTTKLLTLSLGHLGASGVTDAAQPVLDRLAAETGELARLAVWDGARLCWVARAQGATTGLRYDPDMGMAARLSASATGHALLSCLTDAAALALVAAQGFGAAGEVGPAAPRDAASLLPRLAAARRQGYAVAIATHADWMAAIAAPLRRRAGGGPIGTVSLAGPALRLSETRLHELAPRLLAAAAELEAVLPGSPLLIRHAEAA
ncbi:IclR family transcriptional regulator [Roseomonas sp. NAR14]|uniref:IclR family transcriptional regulator n=1 Tax=Roseomonas acroporae TaxID=2937791 RepID=A0A9X2BVY6_9PROT|nr:IclR family transcriptional regulator [Roseomonas acroporae]MCK8787182.1 IclR family transcriptional regulator [Roseomonas acroporae]